MAKNYKDLGKEAKDIISQDFLSGGNVNVSVAGTTPQDINLKLNVKRTVKDKQNNIELSLEPKYEIKSQNIELSGKFAAPSNDYSGNLLVKDIISKGFKLEFAGETTKDSLIVKVLPAYKIDTLALNTSLIYPVQGKKDISLGADVGVVYPNNVYWGIKTDFVLDRKQPSSVKSQKAEVSAHYALKDAVVAGRASMDSTRAVAWGVSFYHKLSDTLKWAADFTLDPKAATFLTAVESKHTKELTLKGKVLVKQATSQDLRTGVSAKYVVNKNVTVVTGVDVNVKQLLGGSASLGGGGGGDDHSFGLDVKLSL